MLSESDTEDLKGNRMLTDRVVMDIFGEINSKEVFCIDTLFVPYYNSFGAAAAEKLIAAEKRNIRGRRILVLPLHVQGNHWVVVIYDCYYHALVHFDSLPGENAEAVALERMNEVEKILDKMPGIPGPWASEYPVSMRNITDGPRQQNGVDCGLYAFLFTKEYVGHLIKNDKNAHGLHRVRFGPEQATAERQRILGKRKRPTVLRRDDPNHGVPAHLVAQQKRLWEVKNPDLEWMLELHYCLLEVRGHLIAFQEQFPGC
jgi:hypothetical protein